MFLAFHYSQMGLFQFLVWIQWAHIVGGPLLKIHGVLACKLIVYIECLDYQFLLHYMETISCSTTVQYMEIGCLLSCLFIMTHNLTGCSLMIRIKKIKNQKAIQVGLGEFIWLCILIMCCCLWSSNKMVQWSMCDGPSWMTLLRFFISVGLHKTDLFSKSELVPGFVRSRLLSIDGCYQFDMLRTMVLVCLP